MWAKQWAKAFSFVLFYSSKTKKLLLVVLGAYFPYLLIFKTELTAPAGYRVSSYSANLKSLAMVAMLCLADT